jgi:membrane protein
MGWIKKIQQNERIHRFIEISGNRISDSDIGNTSVVVAYYLLLSLFPLLIAVGNILPFLSIDPNTILPYLQEMIPSQVYEFIGPAIKDLLTQGSGKLLSVSALGALWSASQSINGLQTAMNRAYGVEQRSNFVIVRIVSFFVIVFFMISIVGVFLVMGIGKVILDVLQPIFQIPTEWIALFQTLKWPITILVLLFMLTIIYWIVPNAKVKLRSAIPGAIFTTIGWMMLSQLFGIYAMYFARKISGYQIIGSFIVLMIWLNFAASIIIFGGILNAIIEEMVSGKEIQKRRGPVQRVTQKLTEKLTNNEDESGNE